MIEPDSLESRVRGIVRDVVREELQAALATISTRRNAAASPTGYLSIANAATFADVAPGTLRRWIRTGRLSARRAGRVFRVDRAELEAFLARDGRGPGIVERAREIVARRP